MKTYQEYMDLAEEAMAKASRANGPETRKSYSRFAQTYVQMARIALDAGQDKK